MRTILFKAKKLSDGKWVKGSLVKTPFGTFIEWYEDSVCNKEEVDSSTVCQFVGLTDCEGKELFEHDLIHIVGFNYAAEVIWSEGSYAFMAVCENKHSYCLHSVIKACKIEIIGNKFDNKKYCMKEGKFDFSEALKRIRKGKLVKR